MKKKQIVEFLRHSIESDLKKAKAALETTKTLSHSDDLKQEGKYDTRAIEAGYLVGAQNKRVDELTQDLQLLDEMQLIQLKDDDEVCLGALIELEINGKTQHYFLSSTGGGAMVKLDDQIVLVISVFSPIGKEVIGLKKGDEFEIETPKDKRVYKIMAIQ